MRSQPMAFNEDLILDQDSAEDDRMGMHEAVDETHQLVMKLDVNAIDSAIAQSEALIKTLDRRHLNQQ